MNILSNESRDRLEEIKNFFKASIETSFSTLSKDQSRTIEDWSNRVNNSFDAFRSEIFVVSCIGMLKAGKSTLVNLFARNEFASPTGYGVDTTLRPALIVQSQDTDGEIEIWIPNEEFSKDNMDEVFLYIGKVIEKDQVKCATCYSYNLTPDNLRNALCKRVGEAPENMLRNEPVIVIIKVPAKVEFGIGQIPDKPLLSSEIVILDTPGLDSGNSNWTSDSERYSWIINHSDLLLFLQSSIAPLNQMAKKILGDIYEKNPKTPIWLVQNEINAKHWLSDTRIEDENKKQREQAAMMFNEISGNYNKLYANLGKAYSALFDATSPESLKKDPKTLLEESQFLSIEDNIRKDLESHITQIRRKNCIESIKRVSFAFSKDLSLISNDLLQKKEENDKYIQTLKTFNSFSDCVKNELDHSRNRLNLPTFKNIKLENGLHFSHQNHIDYLDRSYNLLFSSKKSYSASELENVIKKIDHDLNTRLQNDIDNITLDDFSISFQQVIHTENNQFDEPTIVEKQASNVAAFILDKFKAFIISLYKSNPSLDNQLLSSEDAERIILKALETLQIPPLKKRLYDLSNLETNRIKVKKINVWYNKFLEIKKRTSEDAKTEFSLNYFNPQKKQGFFADHISTTENTIREEMVKWINETVIPHLYRAFKDKFDSEINKLLTKAKSRRDAIERDSDAIQSITDICSELENKMKDF